MSEAIASESWPARISEPSRVFSSHVQKIKEDVVCVKAQVCCSKFPTDQVPQPVPRDTIVLTRMAAPTDFRGAACLPQSAPTVQAQVSSTGYIISCDDCTQATCYHYQCGPECPVDQQGDRAGPLVALTPLSVIPSSSCPASARPRFTSHRVVSELAASTSTATCELILSSHPFTAIHVSLILNPILYGGSSTLKSNNKMQSVNVNCSLAVNNYKGNKNKIKNFLSETAVTEPNNTKSTEPQRNLVAAHKIRHDLVQPNNNSYSYNSVKLLDIVNVIINKNVNKYGALILFPNHHKIELNIIPDNDIPVVLLPIVQGNKYSNYYPPKCSFNINKKLSKIDEYASQPNFTTTESDCKSGTHQQFNTTTSNDLHSNICEFHNDFNDFTKKNTTSNTTKTKTTNFITFDQLIIQQKRAGEREMQWLMRYGVQHRLRLCGGGESSLNTGTSGWGTPPAANANNNNGNNSSGWGSSTAAQNTNNQSNWNNNTTRNNGSGPGQGPGSNNQETTNANKTNNQNSNSTQNSNQNQPPSSTANQGWNQNNTGTTSKSSGPNNQGAPNSSGPGNSSTTGSSTTTSTKQQLEQLNSMREALFSQDGWGGQHVNQDTNWDIPSSPEPGQKDGPGGAPIWKPPVNNGTELWEANLRNGGQPPAQPVQKTPWGHTPTTNIGGTWGEEDDVSDSSNVWTGVPNNPQQWGATGQSSNSAMWGGPKKENEWGNNASGNGSSWGDPRADPRAAGIDPRETIRAASMDPRNSGTAAADPRDSMRMIGGDPMREGMRDPRDLRGITDMRGDPRGGISGRLNGDTMWAPPHPPHQMGHHQPPGKMVGPAPNGVNQWNPAPQPKDIAMTGKPTGWEEPSPPSQRRNMPNFDDGTSLWGNPTQQPNRMTASGKLSHWTDLPSGGPMGARGNACPPGMVGGGRKPPVDGSLWGRNGSWGDDTQQHWGEEAWPKSKAPQLPWDTEIDWHKPGNLPKLTKEIVWNSKQFRHLVEMGYKKEDVENALRLRDMNLDDALDMLSPLRPAVDTWRNSTSAAASAAGRHDEHAAYDHTANAGPYGQRFGPGGPGQMQFPPSGNAPNLMNNIGGSVGNPSLPSINNISPAVVQKILQTGGAGAGSTAGTNIPGYTTAGSQGRVPPQPAQSQPSTQQLRILVQQIQMAVQTGYLNHQILNQPLAPQTLILLNQLLQHIKLLQQLMSQHSHVQNQANLGKANSQALLQLTVNITKTKQQINNLQNQIAANQAIYVKQQMGSGSGQDLFKTNMHDPMTALQSNFSDLTLNKEPPTSYTTQQQQQSRLQQWIKPDKDDNNGVEFSRAPGSVTKPPATHTSPSMNLGLGQSDGPWSTGRSNDTGGWPDSGTDGPDGAGKDTWPPAQASPAAFLDVVPEFEPGKPWKGNQMKSIEDDPTITPGSVVRSPLSLATIKDTEIFSAAPPSSTAPSKASPPVEPLSISSSTWSFNPPMSTPSFTSPLNKIGGTKGAWSDITPQPTAVTTELWGAPTVGKRGPPPGLVKGGISTSNATTNGWTGIGGARSGSGAWGSTNWGSSWLLLRNLTAQIDGSTLQTLCKQHGPLQSFHLYSNHGFALAKYSSREEAIKAQTALNNCVLGNTTILAESPGDSEVNTLMQSLAQQSGSSGAGWRGGGGSKGAPGNNTGADTWGTACWPPNPTAGTASLWGVPQATVDSDAQRATPSSLNSYLPGDLLGGESM